MRNVALFICVFICQLSLAQKKDTTHVQTDTSTLENVSVSAFESKQTRLKDVPASIAVLDKTDLQSFDYYGSFVPIMNTVTGVRMEERSPGSIRLSIRGSLLRSPFGVRDIKIYWDDIPLTDASGNSYLNLVDLNYLQSIEIVKGPAGSLYGANTGGAMILHSAANNPSNKKNIFNGSLIGGINGLLNEQAGWRSQQKNFYFSLQQSHVQSDGYRAQSSLRRDIIKLNGTWNISQNQSLSFLAFYADLYYKTPGGLTLQQLMQDPSSARTDNVTQKTFVHNKTPFGAVTYKSLIGKNILNTTSVVINHTNFTNPTIRNYELRSEWNYGARTTFAYNFQENLLNLQALAGAEWQYNNSHIDDYGNNAGMQDTVQFKDVAQIKQYFFFAQLNANYKHLFLQTGLSRNTIEYTYNRTTDHTIPYPENKTSGPVLAPRFSALYQLNKTISVYGIIAKGFSPPTIAEIIPSNGIFYINLQPEYGWNYELGLKGSVFSNKKNILDISTSLYYFGLKDAIVRREDSTGSEYFVNAGSTIQKGFELWLKGYIIKSKTKFIAQLNISNSLTYQPYRFDQYIYDNNNYSGNKITGVPRFVDVTTFDLSTHKNYYANIILNCTSSIPLNDANTDYAKPYQLLQMKFGKTLIIKKYTFNVFAGVDNALNEVYSLGNDINAAGSRYYNPAPKVNFFAGGKIQF
ncbi:MAG: TonB-dependent receptor [Chitinophagaceae bacterium]